MKYRLVLFPNYVIFPFHPFLHATMSTSIHPGYFSLLVLGLPKKFFSHETGKWQTNVLEPWMRWQSQHKEIKHSWWFCQQRISVFPYRNNYHGKRALLRNHHWCKYRLYVPFDSRGNRIRQKVAWHMWIVDHIIKMGPQQNTALLFITGPFLDITKHIYYQILWYYFNSEI